MVRLGRRRYKEMELMKLFNKPSVKPSVPARVSRMSTPDLTSWASLLVMQAGQALDHWTYRDGPHSEVTDTLTALNQVWTELLGRKRD